MAAPVVFADSVVFRRRFDGSRSENSRPKADPGGSLLAGHVPGLNRGRSQRSEKSAVSEAALGHHTRQFAEMLGQSNFKLNYAFSRREATDF